MIHALILLLLAPVQEEKKEKTTAIRIEVRIMAGTADLHNWKGDRKEKAWSAWAQVKIHEGELSAAVIRLVGDLDSESPEKRDRAQAALEKRGTQVLPELKKAMAGASKEVCARLTAMAERVHPRPEPEIRAVTFSEEDQKAFRKALTKRKDVAMLTAPAIIAYENQPANILVARQLSYIGSYELVFDGKGIGRPSPVIQTANVGKSISMKATADDGRVRFSEFVVSLSGARTDPFKARVIRTPLGDVEDPEIQTVKAVLKPTMSKGEMILVGPIPQPWSEKDSPRVWIMLFAQILELEEDD